MKLNCLKQIFRGSSKKFYQIVQEKRQRLIPQTPEEFILSKYLKRDQSVSQQIHSSIKSKKLSSSTGKERVNYQQILQNHPYGSIIEEPYKGLLLNLMSINFRNIEIKGIFEVCQRFQPDLILIQGKPQHYLPDFKLIPKIENVFSDKLYLQKLTLSGQKIKENLLSKDIMKYFRSVMKQQNQRSQNQKIYIDDTKGMIEDDAILVASYYAAMNNKHVMFGEMPEQPWREWICNSHSLMEIQELFKNVCKNAPFYSSLELSLERLACLLKPQIFLNVRDRYMATLIEMIMGQQKHKKVLGIFGTMQNQAIKHILDTQLILNSENEFTPILQYLIGPPIKSTIIRNVEGWQVIEKHIIFDIMKHGEEILSIPLENFQITNRVINYYGKSLSSYENQNIMRFRHDKTLLYLQVMKNQFEEGSELKKKFMLRQAIRQNQKSM